MKTLEDKLHIAHELGRIAGAAECIEDEGTRDTIYGASESLFEGLLTEAAEEAKASREKTASLINLAQNYPPDPFDYAGVEDSEEPEPKKETNFDRLTKSPEVLGYMLATNASECPRKKCPYDDRRDPGEDACVRCLTDWLNEEAKEE